MNNPDMYIVCNKGEMLEDDGTANFEAGSNFEWITDRAKRRAENQTTPQIVYKLVPVMEICLEVTTKIITKDLVPPADES